MANETNMTSLERTIFLIPWIYVCRMFGFKLVAIFHVFICCGGQTGRIFVDTHHFMLCIVVWPTAGDEKWQPQGSFKVSRLFPMRFRPVFSLRFFVDNRCAHVFRRGFPFVNAELYLISMQITLCPNKYTNKCL